MKLRTRTKQDRVESRAGSRTRSTGKDTNHVFISISIIFFSFYVYTKYIKIFKDFFRDESKGIGEEPPIISFIFLLSHVHVPMQFPWISQ